MGRGTGELPELIVFDLDGTILDTEPVSIQAWITAGQEYGVSITSDQIMPYIGRNADSIKDLAREQFGPEVPFAEIYHRKKEICRLEFARGVSLKPGVHELITTLSELGIRRCIATSSRKVRSENFLESHDLLREFEFVFSGEEVTRSKPHPEIFLRSMARAGVDPGRSMVVEDSRNGIIGARESGATAVLIPDVVPADEIMRGQADLIFEDLFQFRDHLKSLGRKQNG